MCEFKPPGVASEPLLCPTGFELRKGAATLWRGPPQRGGVGGEHRAGQHAPPDGHPQEVGL
jgi:hypothetical protein